MKRTTVSTSNVRLESPNRAVFLTPEDETFHAGDNYGFEFDFGMDDSASLDRGSVSSTGTPVLPDLSSASSFEDLPLDFSSDASGLQARDSFTTSSKLSQGSFKTSAVIENFHYRMNFDMSKKNENTKSISAAKKSILKFVKFRGMLRNIVKK